MSRKQQVSAATFGGLAMISLLASVTSSAAFTLLRKDAFDARLLVKVSPAGAVVRLNEPLEYRKIATTGHLLIQDLRRGADFSGRVSAPGFKAEAFSGRLNHSKKEKVVEITLASESAALKIRTIPIGGQVYLDEKPVGVGPVFLPEVVPGKHRVRATYGENPPQEKWVTLQAGEAKEIRFAFEVTKTAVVEDGVNVEKDAAADTPPATGRVTVESSHPARFLVDNKFIGNGTRITRTVRVGERTIAAIADGRGMKYELVDLQEHDHVRVSFEFNEDPIERAKRANDPSTPDYWVIKGGEARNTGRYGDSTTHFKKALEIDPDWPEAHRQLAFTYPGLKEWDGAIEHAERYLELNPAAPDAKFLREMLVIYRQKKEGKDLGYSVDPEDH
jgi:hypothetical protein